MTVSRAEALVAYLGCGYPQPSERMLELAMEAVRIGRTEPMTPITSEQSRWAPAKGFLTASARFRDRLEALNPADALSIIEDSGLADMHHRGLGSAYTPREYALQLLRHVLDPVAIYEQLRVAGVLDKKAQDAQAKRAQKALAEGRRVTVAENAGGHRTDRPE